MGSQQQTAGGGGVEADTGWKVNRIFTGDVSQYPVELFIHLMEQEGCQLGFDEAKMAANTWCLIDGPDGENPAAAWKKTLPETFPTGWHCLKSALIRDFGRKSDYSWQEKWDLFNSLSRDPEETARSYFIRVQWVLSVIDPTVQSSEIWLKIVFFSGLDEEAKNLAKSTLNAGSLQEICRLIDEKLKSAIFSEEIADFSVEPAAFSPKNDGRTDAEPAICEFEAEVKEEWEDGEEEESAGKKGKKAQRNTRKVFQSYEMVDGDANAAIRPITTHWWKRTKSGKKVYICGHCGSEFDSPLKLKKHTTKIHDGNKFRCDLCDEYSSPKLWCIARHRLAKHDAVTETFGPFYCPNEGCNFRTVLENDLQVHVSRVHEQTKPFKCGVCNKCFPHQAHLRLHVEQVHMKLKKYSCDLCDEKFMWHVQIKKHKREKHKDIFPENPHVCDICGETFQDIHSLRGHVKRRHSGRPLVECKYCKKKVVKECLRNHIRTYHERDERFVCPNCNKAFSGGYALRYHIKTVHMNFKPFKCGACDNLFSRAFGLCVHIGTHHEGMALDDARKNASKMKKHAAFIRLVKDSLGILDLKDPKIGHSDNHDLFTP